MPFADQLTWSHTIFRCYLVTFKIIPHQQDIVNPFKYFQDIELFFWRGWVRVHFGDYQCVQLQLVTTCSLFSIYLIWSFFIVWLIDWLFFHWLIFFLRKSTLCRSVERHRLTTLRMQCKGYCLLRRYIFFISVILVRMERFSTIVGSSRSLKRR